MIRFSPFAKNLFAAAADDGSINIWDIQTAKHHCTFENKHTSSCSGVAFSPINHVLLCSAGLDRKIKFYDIKERSLVKDIDTDHALTSLSFNSDGFTIAVGTLTGTVLVYDLRSGNKPKIILTGHEPHKINTVEFSKPPKSKKSVSTPTVNQSSTTSLHSSGKSTPTSTNDIIKATTTEKRSSTRKKSPERGTTSSERSPPRKSNDSSTKAAASVSSKDARPKDMFSPYSKKSSYEESRKDGDSTPSVFSYTVTSPGKLKTPEEIKADARTKIEQKKKDQLYSNLMGNEDSMTGKSPLKQSRSENYDDVNMTDAATTKSLKEEKIPAGHDKYSTQKEVANKNEAQKRKTKPTIEIEGSRASLDARDKKNANMQRSTFSPRDHQAINGRKDNEINSAASYSSTMFSPNQVEHIRSIIREENSDTLESIKKVMNNLHVEMIRNFFVQMEDVESMLDKRLSYYGQVQEELESLREENRKLKKLNNMQ